MALLRPVLPSYDPMDWVPLTEAQQLLDLFARLEQVSSIELGGSRGTKQPLQRTLQLR